MTMNFREELAFYPDLTIDEKCYFIADHLIAPSDTPQTLRQKIFLNRDTIPDDVFDDLYNGAEKYLAESRENSTVIPDESDEKDETDEKPVNTTLAWFFIIMLAINPFLGALRNILIPPLDELKTEIKPERDYENNPLTSVDTLLELIVKVMFPVSSLIFSATKVNAERLSLSRLAQEIPELRFGTHNHTQIEDAMLSSILTIYDAIAPALNAPFEKLVILVGEQHAKTFWQELFLITIISAYREIQQNPINITFIHEAELSAEVATHLSEIQHAFRLMHAGHPQYLNIVQKSTFREAFYEVIQSYCLVRNAAATETVDVQLRVCPLLAVMAYDFNLVFAAHTKALTPAQTALANSYQRFNNFVKIADMKNKQFIPARFSFPFIFRQVEEVLIEKTEQQLALPGPSITVSVMGAVHLKATSEALNTQGVKHIVLNFFTETKDKEIAARTDLAKHCIKPVEQCHAAVKATDATHCLTEEPFNKKTCDATLQKYFQMEKDGMTFFRSKAVKQIPYTLPNPPANPSDFFISEKAAKQLKEKFRAVKIAKSKENEKAHANRQEL